MENRPAYALKVKEIVNAKLVYHLHNEKLVKQTIKAQEIYDAADCILTVSDYIKRCVQTINPLDKKTRTIYNGINLSAFSKKNKADRSALGFYKEDFILVFCGRMNRDKGIKELIVAMNLLKEYSHIKLMVIGSTFFGNATNEDKFTMGLKAQAEPLKERVIFTGYIPYSKIPNYLKIADVAVIPSIWDDPFPTTVLEAQATGLPIITTRRGGIPEEVTEENAILLDTDEQFVDNLASAILDLYNHPEKRKQMSLTSLERSKFFDKEIYAKNFFAALENNL
jgi:glycosyltransferase involved in cell wall biosynthesis